MSKVVLIKNIGFDGVEKIVLTIPHINEGDHSRIKAAENLLSLQEVPNNG